MGVTFRVKNMLNLDVPCDCMKLYQQAATDADLWEHFFEREAQLPCGGSEKGCPGFISIGDKSPELDVCHGSALKIFSLLNVEPQTHVVEELGDYEVCCEGEIAASDLLCAIQRARNIHPEFTTDFSRSVNSTAQVVIIEAATSQAQLERYLTKLAEIANAALEADEPIVSWS